MGYQNVGTLVPAAPSQAPQKLNLKKLPPGHSMWNEHGKHTVIIAYGSPYDAGGTILPLDREWLVKNDYVFNDAMLAQLRIQVKENVPAPTKNCTQCSASMPMGFRFCPDCGTPQALSGPGDVWVPGSGGSGDAIARLLDPDDPLGSVATATAEPQRRETAEEIYKRLVAEEASRANQDLAKVKGVDLHGEALNTEGTSLQTNPIGTVTVARRR